MRGAPESILSGRAATRDARAWDSDDRMDSRTRPSAAATAPPPSRIERLCIERGLKMTGQRRLSARVLSEAADHHHHLIDVDTGKVIEFADEEFEALARIMARRLGFALVGQRLELFGRKAEPELPRAEARPRARRGGS